MGKSAAFGTQFKMGTRQVETATVVGTITGSGNATVVTTAAGMTGSPITTSVAVLNGDTPDTVATKIRAALALDANITARFEIGGSGALITLTRLVAAANDATLNLSTANGTSTGLTTSATSANTTAGVDYSAIANVTNIGGPGLALDTEDVTTHDQTAAWEEVVGTILRSGEVSLDIVYDPNAATHAASAGLLYKLQNKADAAWQLIFPGPYTWSLLGKVTGFEPGAPVDGALTAAVKIKLSGVPTLV
jgi:hypothetical protein